MAVDWKSAQQKAHRTATWAVTMTKVRIRRVLARTRWQLVTFLGPGGAESVGVVDLLAVRKDHGKPVPGTKRGDALELMLIQVKGGGARMPTHEDALRLRGVARLHHARRVLLASWKPGAQATFFELKPRSRKLANEWNRVDDLDAVFR